MKFHGAIEIAAPIRAVWTAVTDPLPLASCVPGVVDMEQVDATTFRGTVVVSLGPMAGRFHFTSQVGDLRPPYAFAVTVQGTDSVTRSAVEVVVRSQLAERQDGWTRLEYEAVATMGGRIAILGEMVFRAAAQALIAEVTRCLRAQLESTPSTPRPTTT